MQYSLCYLCVIQRRTKVETLKVIEFIPYKDFKEKLKLTKEYDGKAKIEIVEDKYMYVEREVKQ